MTWHPDEWSAFCGLMEEAWPGDFDEDAQAPWRILLDDVSPLAAVTALRKRLYAGHRFRPSVAEFLRAVSEDPSVPTFDEAWMLISRALAAPGFGGARRDLIAERGSSVISEEERKRLWDAQVAAAIAACHPTVQSFVAVMGLKRLEVLKGKAADEEWGEKNLRDLRELWTEHLEKGETRQVAVLAAGGSSELRQLDPLSALKPQPQLPEATT